MNINDYVPAFVNAYYTFVLTSPQDVKKFYHQESTYYRPSMKTNSSEKFNPNTIVPPIPSLSTVTIINYVASPILKSSAISLSITGKVNTQKRAFCFNQYFILQEFSGRICIISDIYNEFEEKDFKETENHEGMTQVPLTQPVSTASSDISNSNSIDSTQNSNNTNTNNNSNQQQQKGNRKNKKKNNIFVYTPGQG